MASNILYRLSRYRWPGVCTEVVRPCGGNGSPRLVRYGSGWWRESAGCSCSPVACGCQHVPAVLLGYAPIIDVTEVKVDGAVIPEAEYRVDEYRYLVRVPPAGSTLNEGWPCCQRVDLPATADDTFQVTFTFGGLPDEDGQAAAAALACEFIKTCSPETFGACRLPSGVSSVVREGITLDITDPTTLFQEGRTGLPEVDLWLYAVNEGTPTGTPLVWSPDIPGRRAWRADT